MISSHDTSFGTPRISAIVLVDAPGGPGADRQLPVLGARRAHRRHRLVLPAALRLGARLLDAARRERRRAASSSGRPTAQRGTQRYLDNTNVLETTFETPERRVPRSSTSRRASSSTTGPSARRSSSASSSRSSGTPRIRVQLRSAPRLVEADSRARCSGSNHVRFEGFAAPLRLTTDIPISYLAGQPFALTERRHLVLTWGAPIEEPLAPLCERFLQRDDALLAALGQGVRRAAAVPAGGDPLGPGAQAPLLRGHRGDRRGDDDVDPGVAGERPDLGLPVLLAPRRLLRAVGVPPARPLRGARAVRPLPDQRRLARARSSTSRRSTASTPTSISRSACCRTGRASTATGPCGSETRRPGSARTTCSARWCSRCPRSSSTSASAPSARTATLDSARAARATRPIAVAGTPDAGIWELRDRAQARQTFSSLMCWAAADRMANVAARHVPGARIGVSRRGRPHPRGHPGAGVERGARAASSPPYGGRRPRCVAAADGEPALPAGGGPAPATAPSTRSGGTSRATGGCCATRGTTASAPRRSAFILCTFWLVEALAAIGRTVEARKLLEQSLSALSPLGAALGGLRRRRALAHVGQLPAGVLARRPDPRRVRGVSALVGGAVG